MSHAILRALRRAGLKKKGQRLNVTVREGQVWRSSDPRRLSSFRVIDITSDIVSLEPIYPPGGYTRAVRIESFQTTGSKGYTRIS